MSIGRDLHFDKGVRVAVGVHGSQMGAAYDTHQQAAFLCVIAQRHQDAATLGTQKTTGSDRAPVSISNECKQWEVLQQGNIFKTVFTKKVCSD